MNIKFILIRLIQIYKYNKKKINFLFVTFANLFVKNVK